MTRCPALVYENTEVVIMQTDEKTFADKFLYPVCNLWAESLLYFMIYQRLTGFVTSTSLSAEKALQISVAPFLILVPQKFPPKMAGCDL